MGDSVVGAGGGGGRLYSQETPQETCMKIEKALFYIH